MGCCIIVGREENKEEPEVAVLYCSTTEVAFGPIIRDSVNLSALEVAQEFLAWLTTDPRRLPVKEVVDKYLEFRRGRGYE